MIKVLFVCMGNICRSPSAEGAFLDVVKKSASKLSFQVDSAGTHSYNIGQAPDRRMQLAAKHGGVDISTQRSRQVDIKDFTHFDYIIAMDLYNLSELQANCPQKYQYKLHKLLDFVADNGKKNVSDPYSVGNFNEIFSLIYSSSEKLLEYIESVAN